MTSIINLDESSLSNVLTHYQFDLRPLALVSQSLNLKIAKYVRSQFEELKIFKKFDKSMGILNPSVQVPMDFYLPMSPHAKESK